MTVSEKRTALPVERGLSTLLFHLAAATDDPPAVEVVAASAGVSLVCAPGDPFGVLPGPGRAIVVVAETAGTIEIAIRPGADGAVPVRLELRRMDAPAAAPAPAVATPAPEIRLRPDLPEGGVEFVVRAHVSLRGDVAAPRAHWICGPDAPGRIEGVEMRAVAGDLPFEYQVAAGGRGAGWSAWTAAGTYAGSRGKALPVIGLRIRLLEGAAPGLVLKADAVFLGSAVTTRRGREIELTGSTPLDPLVGFRLDFAEAPRLASPLDAVPAARPPSRLRIFRRPPVSAPAEAAA